jgi:hypothetical protein
MTETTGLRTDGLGEDRANACRMYDHLLGGTHLHTVDEGAMGQLLTIAPGTPEVAQENRSFMRRAARYLATEAGIVQFLDLGSGIPTQGTENLHEIVRAVNVEARVVYVDREALAVEHYRQILGDDPRTTAIQADLQFTDVVLANPQTRRLIDFSRPVAVVATGVFPFVPDTDNPAGIVATYRDACSPGSYLALSHALTTENWPAGAEQVLELYRSSVQPMFPRTLAQVTGLFSGYRFVAPGLVPTPSWRSDTAVAEDQTTFARAVAGVGVLETAG